MSEAFTEEQKALLAGALQGHVLVTVVGCANDILWGALSDAGIMEPAELPRDLAKIPGLGWNARKATQEARAKFSDGQSEDRK